MSWLVRPLGDGRDIDLARRLLMRKHTWPVGVFCLVMVVSGVPARAQLPSQPVQLLASQSLLDSAVVLTPTNPAIVETLTGRTIFDVTVPRDRGRTHLTLNIGQSFTWHQIPNGAPYQFAGVFRIFVTSNVLPAPGSFEALSLQAEGETHADTSAGSSDEVLHQRGNQHQLTYDEGSMAINLRFAFPQLTDADRLVLARQLIRSRIQFTIQPSATIRAVDTVTFGRIRQLQVFGG
jgi:hypothetical protein